MFRGISLANKCLLLFGAAVVLIIVAALTVPWLRMRGIVDDEELEVARQMVRVWEAQLRQPHEAPGFPPASPAPALTSGPSAGPGPGPGPPASPALPANAPLPALPAGGELLLEGARLRVLDADTLARLALDDAFLAAARARFLADPALGEHAAPRRQDGVRDYRYARAVRDQAGALEGVILLERRSPRAAHDLLVNTVYLLSAGSVALGLAVVVFYLITTKLILSPVRLLRHTAEQVREGHLDVRSQIRTGDEFEDLAETFNQMLANLQEGQRNLRAINRELDRRLGDLEAQNLALAQANRVKGEFLASVSHELRTPLNSILGFADLLIEIVEREAAAGDDPARLAKRRRYLENITTSGKTLLDLITGLLEMAKVEAGKVTLHLAWVDLGELGESLLSLMRPVADKKGVELRLELIGPAPRLETDEGKLKQIVFNLLSNAVKFTGDTAERLAAERAGLDDDPAPPSRPAPHARAASVVLRVETLPPRAAPPAQPPAQPPATPPASGGTPAVAPPAADHAPGDLVRISVLDTGPGIAPEHLARIFEKFTQLDAGHSRKHAGTGLGLAICKELTALLQGEIHVHSEPGRGSMFSVILPQRLDRARLPAPASAPTPAPTLTSPRATPRPG